MVDMTDVGVNHEGDNVMSSKDKVKQIKEERRKNSWFGKVGKFIFYITFFLIIFFVVRRILRFMKIIDNGANGEQQTSGVEMKTNGMKDE
jgi:flagellar biogenesis protein FliO